MTNLSSQMRLGMEWKLDICSNNQLFFFPSLAGLIGRLGILFCNFKELCLLAVGRQFMLCVDCSLWLRLPSGFNVLFSIRLWMGDLLLCRYQGYGGCFWRLSKHYCLFYLFLFLFSCINSIMLSSQRFLVLSVGTFGCSFGLISIAGVERLYFG